MKKVIIQNIDSSYGLNIKVKINTIQYEKEDLNVNIATPKVGEAIVLDGSEFPSEKWLIQ